MRSFEIGRITDIPIRLNITLVVFLPLLAWLISREEQLGFYAGVVNGIAPQAIDVAAIQSGSTPIVVGVATAVGLFVGVLLHELGHSWTARRYGVTITSITLWIFGGMAHMEDLPEDWDVELYVALAGPAMSVLVGVACYALLFVLPAQPILVFVVGSLAIINVTLAVFNLLPAFPMDGGRVLRSLLRGMTVRDMMSTDVRTVTPETSVAEFLDRVVTERTTAYPVMDRGTVTGVVTLDSVRKIPAEDRNTTTVADVMGPAPSSVAPDADAFEALATMSSTKGDRILVVEDGRFIGQVTAADFMTAIEVMQGLGPRREVELPDGYA